MLMLRGDKDVEGSIQDAATLLREEVGCEVAEGLCVGELACFVVC